VGGLGCQPDRGVGADRVEKSRGGKRCRRGIGLAACGDVRRVVWWSWLVVCGVAVASAQSPAPDAAEGRAPEGTPLRIEGVTLGGAPQLLLPAHLSRPPHTPPPPLPPT